MTEEEMKSKITQAHTDGYNRGLAKAEEKIADLKANFDLAIEGRDVKIMELEKENAELKADNDARKFAMVMSEKVEKQLREENAELKEKLNFSTQYYRGEKAKDQLNKAKELLNEFMRIGKASDEDFEHDYSELIGETEQFLKEIEK